MFGSGFADTTVASASSIASGNMELESLADSDYEDEESDSQV